MTITKEKLKEQIESFPDVIEIDDVIDRLIFLEKLDTRIKESDNNETVEEEDLKSEMEKWFE